ncbi:glutaredoxin family protein [Rubricoccus marinus]|uniref:Glutaredoxin domain-containing protein n=1 Tax=Rubricoccus marinus TaxID=716817 RepID=A0A259U3A8_9BACT|nr:glutaredoxin domain-containing protein [Rubricoccus marinus]OZC04294.1 hypothetical protein BSZ36_15680 [Rubricoccus marinus]
MRVLLVVLIAVSGWLGVRQIHLAQRAEAEQMAASAEVVVYVTSWCEVCAQARAHLESKGVEYVARDIEKSPEAYDAYRARGGSGGVPLIVIGDEALMGFNPESVDVRLRAAGA